MEAQVITILLVEDNPADVRLILELLKDSPVPLSTTTAMDGAEALDILRGDAPHPDLILLDVHLPRKSGRETLQELKADERLRTIPVYLLAASAMDIDFLRGTDLKPDGFLEKPVDPKRLLEAYAGFKSAPRG